MTSTDHVRRALEEALGPGASATHRHNHTGTDKLSFAVRLPDDRVWARVATDADNDLELQTWARAALLLAERHAAPPVLDVLRVAGRTALVMPYLEAPLASRGHLRERYDDMRAVLDGLHADQELAALVTGAERGAVTAAAAFERLWVERLTEDLDVVDGYVSPDVRTFLAGEVEVLAELAAGLDVPVEAAIHADPWHENVLVDRDRLWLLDWEDLRIGDPVIDHAILRMDALGSDPSSWPDDPRHAVARRALMLDAALDGAADWVENTDPVVKATKEQAYLVALDAYRAAYVVRER